MSTKLLYLEDSYRKEFNAEISAVENNYAVLNRTCFYPQAGGQDCDKGTLKRDDEVFTVSKVKKRKGDVLHKVDGILYEGDTVMGNIDWERRYPMMKYHTALHVLSRVVFDLYGGMVAGNQIHPTKARIDFDLEEIDDTEQIEKKTNEIIGEGRPVTTHIVSRKKAETMVDDKTRLDMIPDFVKEIRLVEIEDFDVDACGGTHVKNTEEIGEITIIDVINKGKKRKRIVIS